jgi:hypothetical protein
MDINGMYNFTYFSSNSHVLHDARQPAERSTPKATFSQAGISSHEFDSPAKKRKTAYDDTLNPSAANLNQLFARSISNPSTESPESLDSYSPESSSEDSIERKKNPVKLLHEDIRNGKIQLIKTLKTALDSSSDSHIKAELKKNIYKAEYEMARDNHLRILQQLQSLKESQELSEKELESKHGKLINEKIQDIELLKFQVVQKEQKAKEILQLEQKNHTDELNRLCEIVKSLQKNMEGKEANILNEIDQIKQQRSEALQLFEKSQHYLEAQMTQAAAQKNEIETLKNELEQAKVNNQNINNQNINLQKQIEVMQKERSELLSEKEKTDQIKQLITAFQVHLDTLLNSWDRPG